MDISTLQLGKEEDWGLVQDLALKIGLGMW